MTKPAAKAKAPARGEEKRPPPKRSAKAPGKLAALPAATQAQVSDALASMLALESGPWRESDACATMAKSLGAAVTGEQVRIAVADAIATGEVIAFDDCGHHAIRRNPSHVAATALGMAICRAMGEAHAPLAIVELHNAILRIDGAPRPSRSKLAETVKAMVPAFAAAHGDRYWTPDATVAVEPVAPPPVMPAARPLPTVAELAATAERKPLRIVEPLTVERRAELESIREANIKAADRAAQSARELTRDARTCTKAIRKGQESRVVDTVTVPDYARDLLVTLDVSGAEPREIKSRKLGAKFRQLALFGEVTK